MNAQSLLSSVFMFASILSAGTAVAQQGVPQPSGGGYESTAVRPGDRVRVETVSWQAAYVGTVAAMDETTITLEGDVKGQRSVLRRVDVTRLDVSVGESSRSTHVLAGALIGGGLGAVIGLASGDDPDSEIIAFSAVEKAGMLGFTFALAGMLVGLILPAGEQWEEIPINHGQVSIDPADGSIGYSLVYRF